MTTRLMGFVMRFLRADQGATAIEYAMLACFVAIVIVAAIQTLGINVQSLFQKVLGAFN